MQVLSDARCGICTNILTFPGGIFPSLTICTRGCNSSFSSVSCTDHTGLAHNIPLTTHAFSCMTWGDFTFALKSWMSSRSSGDSSFKSFIFSFCDICWRSFTILSSFSTVLFSSLSSTANCLSWNTTQKSTLRQGHTWKQRQIFKAAFKNVPGKSLNHNPPHSG